MKISGYVAIDVNGNVIVLSCAQEEQTTTNLQAAQILRESAKTQPPGCYRIVIEETQPPQEGNRTFINRLTTITTVEFSE